MSALSRIKLAEMERLRVENERLRAALREVQRMVDLWRWEHINSIARLDDDALSGKGES